MMKELFLMAYGGLSIGSISLRIAFAKNPGIYKQYRSFKKATSKLLTSFSKSDGIIPLVYIQIVFF